LDKTRRSGGVSQRVAQASDRVVQAVFEIYECVGRPELSAEFFPRDNVAGMPEQNLQYLERLPLEGQAGAPFAQFAGASIKFERAETQQTRGWMARLIMVRQNSAQATTEWLPLILLKAIIRTVFGEGLHMPPAWKVRLRAPALFVVLSVTMVFAAHEIATSVPQEAIRAEEHYVLRDGLRIYLWEKYLPGRVGSFAQTGKVVLLVHGGTRSGRSLYDVQIRDYSLMDFLAQHDYDVWAIDIHGYGHSDPGNDWIDAKSAAADIDSAVQYITRLRKVSKLHLLGASAGTQRAGLFAMEHPEKVNRLILHAPFWKGGEEFRERNRQRIENGGQPLPRTRPTTEADFRDGFVPGQFEQDVVDESVRIGMQNDRQRPNVFAEYARLPILDPKLIVVPTLVIFGEKDFAANDADLLPFFEQLSTHDKSYVQLPDNGHMMILEKGHRRLQHEILSFLDRP